MLYLDERGICDSSFIIGSIKGDIAKISVRERSMKDIKRAMSSMEEKSLEELAYGS
jgi:hypothetical protein